MTGLEVYAIVKFWMPLATAFGLIIKAWLTSKAGITEWAHSLLNNHLTHIQKATEEAAATMKIIAESNAQIESQITTVGSDLRRHQDNDVLIQGSILTGIEVLKAKMK